MKKHFFHVTAFSPMLCTLFLAFSIHTHFQQEMHFLLTHVRVIERWLQLRYDCFGWYVKIWLRKEQQVPIQCQVERQLLVFWQSISNTILYYCLYDWRSSLSQWYLPLTVFNLWELWGADSHRMDCVRLMKTSLTAIIIKSKCCFCTKNTEGRTREEHKNVIAEISGPRILQNLSQGV